jgi:hypothetical protein
MILLLESAYISRMLAMREHGGDEDLHGLNHRSVIPYIHERMRVILQCVIQALVWLFVALSSA